MTFPASRYTDLITWQHADKPKFFATVDQNTAPYSDLEAFIEGLVEAFDLDTAVGVQLDAVGVRVGISRDVPIPIDQGWFAFSDARHGFGLGFWRGPYAIQYGIESFDDDTYRLLIRAKIVANSSKASVATAINILSEVLATSQATWFCYAPDEGSSFLPDVGDFGASALTISGAPETDFASDFGGLTPINPTTCSPRLIVGFAGTLPSTVFMIIVKRQYVPVAPAGASYDVYATTVNGARLFGFGMQNEYVSGFGAGAWGQDPEVLANEGLI